MFVCRSSRGEWLTYFQRGPVANYATFPVLQLPAVPMINEAGSNLYSLP